MVGIAEVIYMTFEGIAPTFSCLSRQHNTVSSIQYCVSNIASLGSSWAWFLNHAFQHLRGDYHWLPSSVTTSNHHLLSNEHFRRWDLNPEVTTGNHDAVTGTHNLVKVLHSLFILNLQCDITLFKVCSSQFMLSYPEQGFEPICCSTHEVTNAAQYNKDSEQFDKIGDATPDKSVW